MHSLVRRIPMALGPLVGGLCISVWGERGGIRIAFAVALGMAIIALFLQQWMVTGEGPKRSSGAAGHTGGVFRLWRLMNPSLKQLLLSDILIRFCEQIPYAFVVIWSMKTIARPVTGLEFGILTTIEMATAVAVYIPVAYLADRSTKKPFVLITFGFFTLFPLVLLYSRSFEWLVGAFILRGLKEFGEPTRKALILDLCPETFRAGMFGVYYLIRDLIVSLAAFGGAFLWKISPATNLVTAFFFGVIGTVTFAIVGRDSTVRS